MLPTLHIKYTTFFKSEISKSSNKLEILFSSENFFIFSKASSMSSSTVTLANFVIFFRYLHWNTKLFKCHQRRDFKVSF